jgi:hypothetical protein
LIWLVKALDRHPIGEQPNIASPYTSHAAIKRAPDTVSDANHDVDYLKAALPHSPSSVTIGTDDVEFVPDRSGRIKGSYLRHPFQIDAGHHTNQCRMLV